MKNVLISIDPSFKNTGMAGFIDGVCVDFQSTGLPTLAQGKKHRPACPTAYRFDKLAGFLAQFSSSLLRAAELPLDHKITFVVETPQTQTFTNQFAGKREKGGADMATLGKLIGFLLGRLTINHSDIHEISATEWGKKIATGGKGKPRRCMLASRLVGCEQDQLNDGEADAILLGMWWIDREALKSKIVGGKT